MRRALGGLLLNARRAIADTNSLNHHHHHHHTHHCSHTHHHQHDVLSAFALTLPSFEHPHHPLQHDHPHIPCASEQAASGLLHQHLHFHPHHHPMLSALGSIRQGFSQTRLCNTGTFTTPSCQTPLDPHIVPLAASSTSSPPIHSLPCSTFQGRIQQASLYSANVAERFSHDATPCDLSSQEMRKLLKLIKVEDFKKRLFNTGRHCMSLEEVLELCKQTGTATSDAEAEEIAKTLDEAGFILIFRKKVFLKPEKVAEVLSRAIPLPLALEDDPRNQEYARLQKEKEEIDQIAHKQVRNMLWGAFGVLSAQSILFFRLTFWELSWDVMEPIAFFVTSSSLLAGFFFFVITKRDPSYHDFMDTLFSSQQRKLIKKRNFDLKRFKELQVMCCLPNSQSSSKQPHISDAY